MSKKEIRRTVRRISFLLHKMPIQQEPAQTVYPLGMEV